MINRIQLLRNIGQFDNVSVGARLPFSRIVLIYAENGRGKTTITATLRSLASGDPLPLSERRRLSAQHPAHAVIECAGGPAPAVFQNGSWDRTLANVAFFDEAFVDENIYSGLAVTPEHRQNLHELMLGARGVKLQQDLDQHVRRIETHNAELRRLQAAIPSTELGPFSLDEFCTLQVEADVDAGILELERKVAAVQDLDPIRQTQDFDALSLPDFDLELITSRLRSNLSTLDAAAAERVREHLASLGGGAEAWLSEGLRHVHPPSESAAACPFCLQALASSTLVDHYRAYFSQEYLQLRTSVTDTLVAVNRSHAGDVPAAFERAVRMAVERRQFWVRFCEVPEVALDTAAIAGTWRVARDGVVALLQQKVAAPTESIELSPRLVNALATYAAQRARVAALSNGLQQANARIKLVRDGAAAGNIAALESALARLKAVKARHTASIALLCDRYSKEKTAKAQTAALREQAKAAVEQYRTTVLPTYKNSVNEYLQRFNASFLIESISPVTSRGGAACNYTVLVDRRPVAVSGATSQPGAPSFRNTLSAGDRNTLALAFFFTALDQDPELATKTVVVDDPVSSLDEQRSFTTSQEVRRLAERVAQVVVLSHDKRFLARIWDGAIGRMTPTTLQIVRDGLGSTLAEWNVRGDATTEYDRRHSMLREFLESGRGDPREVARAIRPVLEGFERVAHPEHFPPGSMLGPFLGACEQRVGTPSEILSANDIATLRAILEYANRFHHDANPAWETETPNDGELRGFALRALGFVRR